MTLTPFDNGFSRLGAHITSGATSLWVLDPSGFADATELIIGTEVLGITGGSGTEADPWTISRAQRGTTARRHLRDAVVRGVRHTIVLHAPTGGTSWDYTARWGKPRNWRISRTNPGGDGEASWTITERANPLTSVPTLGSHVELADTDGVYWIGVVDEVAIDWRRSGSAAVTIIARGYAITADDEIYQGSKVWPAFTPIYQVMRDARTDLCPLISLDNSLQPGGGRSILSDTGDMTGKTARQIWEQVAALGDVGGVLIDWQVHGNGTSFPLLEIRNRPWPTTYTVDRSDCQATSFRWRRSSVRNRATVRFSSGFATAEDTAPITKIGAVRDQFSDASNQIGGIGEAQQIAATIVAAKKDPQPIGERITVQYPNAIGGLDAFWRARAGANLHMTGVDTGNTNIPMTDSVIRVVEIDMDRREVTFATEELHGIIDEVGQMLRSEIPRPDSPVHQPPSSGGAVVPQPQGSAPNLPPNVPVLGSDGRVGYRQLSQGLDKVPLTFQFGNKVDASGTLAGGETGIIQPANPVKLISVKVIRDNEAGDAGDITVSISKSSPTTYPTLTHLIDVNVSAGHTGTATFVTDPAHPDKTQLAAGEFIVVTVGDDPDPTSLLHVFVYVSRKPGEVELPIDTAAPAADVTVSGGNPSTFHIVATEDCWAQVEYGTTSDYGSFSAIDEDFGVVHDVPVDGFLPGEQYYYRVHLWDIAGNHGIGGGGTFIA